MFAQKEDLLVLWARERGRQVEATGEEPGLGPFVKTLRQGRNLTQEQLGAMLEPPASQSEISAIENGRIKLPPLARVRQLATALGVTPYDFLEQSGWTGASLHYKEQELSPEVGAITSRYRKELIELLPRMRSADMRSLVQIAKKMAREEG